MTGRRLTYYELILNAWNMLFLKFDILENKNYPGPIFKSPQTMF